jgi:hypothetical protein
MYFNHPEMIDNLKQHLKVAGVDVAGEQSAARLIFFSERPHLKFGCFDIKCMMQTLEEALDQALNDGHAGLWAAGDIGWEFGPENDYSKLLDYESHLDAFFYEHKELSGICQYHRPTLPKEAVGQGLYSHPTLFISETLSVPNPNYLKPELLCF